MKARWVIACLVLAAGLLTTSGAEATEFGDEDLRARFQYLSEHGNSYCPLAFEESIASMPDDARLKGSCCGPMEFEHYAVQLAGLRQYASIPEIPADPYDIEARLAKKLMAYDSLELTEEEREAYDYAMRNSEEGGPCCCPCWRYRVYGGLAKHLIPAHGFTGAQVAEVWDLSEGCGGDGEH